ncbi:DUF418 domain-containing protein [Actinoallomurus rhizosphaericola]|uniref:DUF418 domain-containing protein n=1 Tax=Actinoallomurus rhizosphaericola TaxID=2952536 RepID=UPI00209172FC|nr:DUF418 domain-containing protein [Actinoallomurus rhizosphaericola]MCO5994641.1 DUF418 domain-containing protein [Actinoallomurus rhizosphaericola]
MTTTPSLPAPAAPPAGPVRRAERAPAPDLARGVMLLFIALANASNSAFAGQPGLDGTPHGAQRVVNFLMSMFVESRAYPVFAVMFGYSLVQLASRQRAAGADERRVLLRRNTALVGFGLVHGILLYWGDFLGAYGIVGILATLLLLRRGDRFHRIVLWLWGIQTVSAVVLTGLAFAGARGGHAVLTNTPDPSLAASSYGRALLDRLTEWPVHTATVVPFIVIVWLGIWAARRRVLEEPAAHRRLLRRTAVVCLGITFAGALPYALVTAGVLHLDTGTVGAMARVHDITGEYGGPGYVALFGLLALRLSGAPRGRALLGPVSALGQRSLSGYLFQSVAWLVLFSPWALHLGGTYAALLAAVAVWAVSLAAAQAMSAAAYRGPAETLLRRITYRPARRTSA